MAEAEVKTFWQRQRLAEAEVENPHLLLDESDSRAFNALQVLFLIPMTLTLK